MKRILKWLNNNFLPISYNLWKEDKDKIYFKINENLKPAWLNSQISIFSGMWMPIIIFFLGFFFVNAQNRSTAFWIFILYFIIMMFLNIKNNDLYLDEKYLNLSKAKKGK